MKTPNSNRLTSALTAVLLAGTLSLSAQDGIWTNEVDSLWSETTNWFNGVVADGAGNTATFTNEFGSAVIVSLDSSRTLENLNFGQGIYSIFNGGGDTNILTLAGPSKPVITVPTGIAATINRTVLAGTDGFIVDGGGTLALFKQTGHPANTISGDVILSNSIVAVQEGNTDFNVIDPALDSLGSFTFYGDSTVNLLSDGSTGPSYGTPANNWIVPEGQIGTIILPARFNGTSENGGAGMSGTLTGGGTLNLQTRYVRANIGGDWSAFTGQINADVQLSGGLGQWRFGNAAGFPNAVVNLTGTSAGVQAFYYPNPGAAGVVIPIGALMGDNAGVTLAGGNANNTLVTFRVGALRTNPADMDTYLGSLGNNRDPNNLTGRLRLVKEGAGTLILGGNNAHSGGTIVSNGVLQIGNLGTTGTLGTGGVTNWSSIVINRGGSFAVPGDIYGNGTLSVNIYDDGLTGDTVSLTGANNYAGATTVAAGKAEFGSASTFTGSVTVNGGARIGGRVTSAGGTATVGNVSFGSGCALEFNLLSLGNPTAPVVNSTGNVDLSSGDVTVNIEGNSFELSPGTFTLFTYTSRSGGGSFVQGSLPSNVTGSINDDTANNRVTLTITVVFDPTLVYVGDASGVWDVGNMANQIWKVADSGVATNYYDSARVRFDDTATGTTSIDLPGFVAPSVVTVNNTTKSYTLSSSNLSGAITDPAVFPPEPGRLRKRGTGTLTLLYDSPGVNYSGLTTIEEGTISVGNGGDVGSIGTGGIVNEGLLVVNRTNNLSNIGPTITGNISGTGSVVIMGTDKTNTVVTLSSAVGGSTYSGGTIISNAAVQMGNASANSLNNSGTGLGVGTATFWGDCQLDMFQSNADGGDNGFDFNPIINVPAGQTLDYRLAGRCREASTLLGAGTVSVRARWIRCYLVGDWSQFTGQIIFYGESGREELRLNDTLGFPNARVHLANPDGLGNIAAMMNQGAGELYYPIGELTGDPGSLIDGSNGDGGDAPASTVWVVGGLNTDATYAGDTADPGNADHNFVKEGTGTWTMSGTNISHAGFTTVSNGVLALSGTAGLSNSVRVTAASPGSLSVTGRVDSTLFLGTGANVQTLAGNGTIRGNVVLGANGILETGFSIGTLTVTDGSVTLGGTNNVQLNRNGGSPISDKLVAPNITLGGTLRLFNAGAPLQVGDTFDLFDGTLSGSFATLDLGSYATFDTSQLATTGIISVTGVQPPPTLSVSSDGTNITLSSTGGTAGGALTVVSSTDVTVPLEDWAVVMDDVYDGSGNYMLSIPIDAGTPEIYYAILAY